MEDELILRAELRDDVALPARRVAGAITDVGDAARRTDRHADRAAGSTNRLRGGLSGLVGITGRAASGLGGVARSLARVTAAGLRTTAIVGTGLVAALGAASVRSFKLASDAGEVQSKFSVVFGAAAGSVQTFVDDLHTRFGIATTELQDMAAGFGVLGQAAGIQEADLGQFSEALTSAALDLGSFYNASPEEVGTAIRAGLVGETEPLRRFGIQINETLVQAKAEAMGFTGELTEQQKVLARNELIMERFNASAAKGDLERTARSGANLLRNLGGRISEISKVVGGSFLRAFETIGPTLESVLVEVEGSLGPFTAWLDGVLQRGAQGFISLVDNVRALGVEQGVLATIRTYFGTDVVETIEAGRDALAAVRDTIREAGPAVSEAAPSLEQVRDALRWIADNADKLVPAVLAGVAALKLIGGTRGGIIRAQRGLESLRATTALLNAVQAVSNLLTARTIAAMGGQAAAQGTLAITSGGLTAATSAQTVAQRGLNLAFLANPITWVVLAIVALVAALVILYQRSETVRNAIDAVWAVLKDGIKFAVNNVVIPYLRMLLGVWTGTVEGLLRGAATAARAMGMEGLAEKLDNAAGEVRGFRERANSELDKIQNTVRIFADGRSALEEIGRVRTALQNTALAGASVGAHQGGITVGTAPGGRAYERLYGGPVTAGQTYLVGEVGPELFVTASGTELLGQHGPQFVVPTESGFIEPADRTAALIGASAGAHTEVVEHHSYTVNINGAQDPAAVRREFETWMRQRERGQNERRTRWQH